MPHSLVKAFEKLPIIMKNQVTIIVFVVPFHHSVVLLFSYLVGKENIEIRK